MPLINSLSDLSQQAIEEFRKATANDVAKRDDLAKAASTTAGVTTATGLVWFDLQTPSRNFFPVLTPLRNKIPRVSGGGGLSTNWIQVTKINALNLRGAVPEGRRGGVHSITAEPKSMVYKAIGLEGLVTIEAELAAVNFEDIRATSAQRLMWSTMIEEELFDLGGNASVALGTCPTPTVAATATGGTIVAGTYLVYCVALAHHGAMNSSIAMGVPGQVQVTNPTGFQYTYNAGASLVSLPGTTGAITGVENLIAADVEAIRGAIAYAWYVDDGASGDATLQAITYVNSVSLTALTTSGEVLASQHAADHSKNALGYDGLLYHAFEPTSGAYFKSFATGTPGVGTPLTSDGAGGIVEIDAAFQYMWDTYRLGPDIIYVNSQESANITKKLLAATTGVRYDFITTNPSGGAPPAVSQLTGGARVRSYVNKFGLAGKVEVPIEIHPNMPPGTILGVCEQLPYPLPNITNVYEQRLRRDYYQMEWPMRERQYESGVYFDGVLADYFPPHLMVMTNIGNG